MNEKVNVTVSREIANVMQTIQALKDCGIINVNDELTSMDGIWDKLNESDKRFIAGMIKGSATMMIQQKQ